ncbi:hypothetical protein [Modestobacter sp. SYSU DS0875]
MPERGLALRPAGVGLTRARVGGRDRITARRYLEYLAGTGVADRIPRYRGAGRPEHEYR